MQAQGSGESMKLYQQAYLFTAWESLQLQAGTLVLFFNFHLFLLCLIFTSFLFYSYLTKKSPPKTNKKPNTNQPKNLIQETPPNPKQQQPHKNPTNSSARQHCLFFCDHSVLTFYCYTIQTAINLSSLGNCDNCPSF